MAVTLYEVLDTDNPNSGRIKWNSSDSNLKAGVDANTAARTGIGSVVGTTATQTLTNKTITSQNAGGTNVISITRKDISTNFMSFTTDSGSKTITVNGAAMTDVDILGSNGIETKVDGGIIYIQHPGATILNEAAQTLAVAKAAVEHTFTVDINGHTRINDGLAIGDGHTSVSIDQLHIKDTDNGNYVSATVQNAGTGGAQIKLMETPITKYWFMRWLSGATDAFQIGINDTGAVAVAISIADDVTDGTLSIITGQKIGINNSSPSYGLQLGTGIGIDATQLVLDPTTGMRLDHPGAGTIDWKSDTNTVMQLKANGKVGIGTNANDSYALIVLGATSLNGATTISSSLAITGTAYLNGGIAVDTNKFTVADNTGDTLIAGTLAVTGAVAFSDALSVANNLSIGNGKALIAEYIKAVDTDGITFQTSAGISTCFVDSNASFRIMDLLATDTSSKLGVKGDAIFVADDLLCSNQIKLSGDSSGNYIDTSDYDLLDGQEDLLIRVAGTGLAERDFYIKTGKDTVPGNLSHTSLFIDSSTENMAINKYEATDFAPDVLNIYGSLTNDVERSYHFHIGSSTALGINAYWDSAQSRWERANVNNAGKIQLADTALTLSVAASGGKATEITWTDALRIGTTGSTKGHIGILENPSSSYSVTIISGLNSDSFNTGAATVDTLIAATSVTTDSLVVSPGADIVTIEDNIEMTSVVEHAFIATKSASASYIPATPMIILQNSVGENHVKLQGTLDNDGHHRAAFTSQNPTNFYLYSSSIRAGDHFKAGYAGSGGIWCPVPFTVYADPTINHYLNATPFYWYDNVVLPLNGIYKISIDFRIDWNNDDDYKAARIVVACGGVEVSNWYWKSRVATKCNYGSTQKSECFTCLGYRSASTGTALTVTLTDNLNLDTAQLRSVHMEWVAPDSTFPAP